MAAKTIAEQINELGNRMNALHVTATSLEARGRHADSSRVHDQWCVVARKHAALVAKAEANAEDGYIAQGIEL